MTSIDDIVTKVQGLTEDTARVLDAVKGERLSEETRAKVEALGTRLDEVNAAMDAAVPPAEAPSDPTGGGDAGDGTGEGDGTNSSRSGRSRR